jgi:F420-dependent oxidoreductase-like protein
VTGTRQGRYAIKTPPQHGAWVDFLDVWRAADEIDVFESAWTMDHFYPLTPPIEGTILESWTMLAALAQATKRIRLGSMVNGMHFRHPAVTANMAATVDHISNGRFDLGLGAGWFVPEADAYGLQLGTMKERFDRFDEGVEVIHRLLTQATTTFSGAYYELVDARCEPKSVQSPRVPIAIGGQGKKRTLRTVARYADHWDGLFPATADAWRSLDDVLRGHCEVVGRNPDEITRSIHVSWPADADPSALVAAAQPYFEAGVDVAVFSMRGPYRANLLEPLATAIERS